MRYTHHDPDLEFELDFCCDILDIGDDDDDGFDALTLGYFLDRNV